MLENLVIRSVQEADKEALAVVESKSTPNLRYVPHVFAMFHGHERGEFSLAELEDEVVACAKFTVLPIQIYQWTSRPQAEFRNIAAAAIIVLLVLYEEVNILTLQLFTQGVTET